VNAISQHWDIVKSALADEKRNKPNVFKTVDSDFLPAALEIIERPVSPTARVTTWVLLSGLVITGLWLTFGKIDVVASANGKLRRRLVQRCSMRHEIARYCRRLMDVG
jgi:hemolysin D